MKEHPPALPFRCALVTGATGCLGRALVRLLLARGCTVHALVRDESRAALLFNGTGTERLRILPGDVRHQPSLERALEGVDAVFHTAGKAHCLTPDAAAEAAFFEVNVNGSRNLARACRSLQLKTFIFFSTIAVFGTSSGPLNEQTVCAPQTPYARSKFEAEQAVRAELAGIVSPTVFRLSMMYGEGERGNFGRLIRAVERGRFVFVGDGETKKSVIYVEDVAEAAVLAAAHPEARGELYVLSDAEPYSMKSLVTRIATELGRTPPSLHVPVPVVGLATAILGTAGKVLSFKPSLNPADVRTLTTDVVCDTRKVQMHLGFQIRVGLNAGIARTIRSHRQQLDAPKE